MTETRCHHGPICDCRMQLIEAVVAAARAWAEKYDRPGSVGITVRALIDAVRALDDANG